MKFPSSEMPLPISALDPRPPTSTYIHTIIYIYIYKIYIHTHKYINTSKPEIVNEYQLVLGILCFLGQTEMTFSTKLTSLILTPFSKHSTRHSVSWCASPWNIQFLCLIVSW